MRNSNLKIKLKKKHPSFLHHNYNFDINQSTNTFTRAEIKQSRYIKMTPKVHHQEMAKMTIRSFKSASPVFNVGASSHVLGDILTQTNKSSNKINTNKQKRCHTF